MSEGAANSVAEEVDDEIRESAEAEERLYRRSGLNASEAAIAWAICHFGSQEQAYERLHGGIGDLIRDVTEPVVKLDEEERFSVLERWREQDRAWDRLDGLLENAERAGASSPHTPQDGARWASARALIAEGVRGRHRPWRRARSRTRRAVEWLAIGDCRESLPLNRPELRAQRGFDYAALAEMPHGELRLFFRQLGVYQLAELSHRQPRRDLVRLRHRLPSADREWFDHCVIHAKHLDDESRARTHRLLAAISNQGASMAQYLIEIGLYLVAGATQARFGHPMRFVARALPAELAGGLERFNRRAATLPAVIAAQLRVKMDLFVEQWRGYHGAKQAKPPGVLSQETYDDSEV